MKLNESLKIYLITCIVNKSLHILIPMETTTTKKQGETMGYHRELKESLAKSIICKLMESKGNYLFEIRTNENANEIKKDIKELSKILIKKLSYNDIASIYKTTYKDYKNFNKGVK